MEKRERPLIDSYYNSLLDFRASVSPFSLDEDILRIRKNSDEDAIRRKKSFKGLPEELLGVEKYRVSLSYFYYELMPLVPKASRFKPSVDTIAEIGRGLGQEEGVAFNIAYAFAKSLDQNGTGSHDSIIDVAELIMLEEWMKRISIAERLGLRLRINFLDEIPLLYYVAQLSGKEYLLDALGFRYEDLETNQLLLENMTRLHPDLNVISLYNLLSGVYGEHLPDFICEKKELLWRERKDEVDTVEKEPSVIFDREKDSPFRARLRVFSKMMNIEDLEHLASLVTPLSDLAITFDAAMQLRSEAFRRIRSNDKLRETFPHFDNVFWAGITRTTRRISFLPVGKRFHGRTVNPMHGLAVFSKDDSGLVFRGIGRLEWFDYNDIELISVKSPSNTDNEVDDLSKNIAVILK